MPTRPRSLTAEALAALTTFYRLLTVDNLAEDKAIARVAAEYGYSKNYFRRALLPSAAAKEALPDVMRQLQAETRRSILHAIQGATSPSQPSQR